ncbi:PKD domain-containing protein [Flammeovirga agarivorans]|uniref:T9SS type A sorting domain-containing protein n=1 Tax=Flammeovirga agarivorans TaxID=2726742 RepID=A0A7X8SN96_9BACT|nr:T9SS type A sorting domain-containing protein [Flammeovirga agarivorans]NLR93366.1 T9SS type A sorting domain-containing protein [Flammeovirga agarivorans]
MKYIYKLHTLLWLAVYSLCFHTTGQAQSFDGAGTVEDPYLISSKAQLIELDNSSELWGMHFKLTTDIDMDGETFHPIGYKVGSDVSKTFKGSFDGGFNTISNLTITKHPDQSSLGVGFIGYSQGASIKHLGIINLSNEQKVPNIERVGGLIGHAEWNTIVDQCFILGGKVSGSGSIGGLIGMVVNVTLTDCFAAVELDAKWGNNGGIVGNMNAVEASASITNATTYGTVLNGVPGITADANIKNDIAISGLYAISTTGKENPSDKVTVLTPLEMTDASQFSALDFTESGAWKMNTNSYPVLSGFPDAAFSIMDAFYDIPLTVTSNGTDPISGATVTINLKDYTTDANGNPEGLVESGTYDYSVNAEGYNEYTGSFSTGDEQKTITLVSDALVTYTAAFVVKDEDGEVVADATFNLKKTDLTFDKSFTTDAEGKVTVEKLVVGDYEYAIQKTLFEEKKGTFTLSTENYNEEITLVEINKAPVAVVGSGRTVESGEVVTLYGADSYDENKDALSFTWTAPDGVTLSNAYAAIPTFTVPVVTETTTLTFSLVVNDGEVDSEPATVSFVAKSKIINGLNLIVNGGFEEELTKGWTGMGAYAQSDVVDPMSKGSKSVKFETSSKVDGVQTHMDDFIDVEIGKAYKFSGKVRVDKMMVTVFNLRFMPSNDWFDADNAKFSITQSGSGWGDLQPEKGSWVSFEKILTFDEAFAAGSSKGDVVSTRLHLQSSNDATDELIYFDDLMLEETDIDFTLSAGEDQTTLPGATVDLMGSHNSSNSFTYTWEAPEGITLTSTNTLATSFDVASDITEETTYTLKLKASDGSFEASDEVNVVVVPGISANAGDDQTVDAGDIVTLDASNTTPEDVTLTWTAPEGITLSDVNVAMPTFTAPIVTESTTFTFSLAVNLGESSASDEVVITVNPSSIPVADAGNDQTVGTGATITLDGSGSQSQTEGDLSYAWTAPEGITLSDNTAAMPTFTAPMVEGETSFTFSLIVNDGVNSSKADDVVITVINEKISGLELLVNGGFEEGKSVGWSGIESEMFSISDIVSEQSKGTSSLEVAATAKIDLVETSSDSYFNLEVGKQYKFTGKILVETMNVEVYNIRFMPSDEWKDSGATKLGITAPGISWGDFNATIGEWVSFEKIITIDENFHISKSLSQGDIVPTRLYIQTPKTEEELFYLDDFSVVEYGIDFQLDAGDDIVIQSGSSVDLMATHNSSDEFTYTWTAPSGVTLSSTDMKSTTFTSASGLVAPMEYEFTVTAKKGMLSYSDKVKVTVVPEINANAGDDQVVKQGTTVTLDASATTPEETTFVWEAPEGITLSDNTSAMPTFTAPNVTEETTLTFTLRAQYLEGESTDEVEVLVYPELVANAGDDQVAYINSTVTLDATATIPQNANITWTAPEGITLSDANALQPTFNVPELAEDTEYTFTLTATYRDMTSTDEVMITIKSVEQPVANAGEDQTVNAGDEVTLDGTASTPLDVQLEWIVPEGITLSDVNSATPTFTAPELEYDNDYVFVLKATVADMVVTDQVTVTVLSANIQAPTSAEDLAADLVKCYPNPTHSGRTNIELLSDAEVSVINLSGQVVERKSLSTGIHELDLSDAASGVYILHVQSESFIKSIQLIVK